MPRLQLRQWISTAVLMSVFFWYGSVPSDQPVAIAREHTVPVTQWPVATIPVRTVGAPEPVLFAQAAYVTAEESGAVLYSKNATQTFPPASLTKLMTALVARTLYPSGTVFTIFSPPARLDSKPLFRAGEFMTVENLLAAALIQSNNEAALVLAQNHPDGESGFIAAMNANAQYLKLTDTQYVNSIGFDHPQQFSTARDSALLAREVLKDPLLRRLVATAQFEISDTALANPRMLKSTNQLLGIDDRISGIKTGTTTEAGQVLVTLAVVKGQSIIIVVLGSTDRYKDTLVLLDWVTEQYQFAQESDL